MSKDVEGWYQHEPGYKRHYYRTGWFWGGDWYSPLCGGLQNQIRSRKKLDHDDANSDNCKRCLKALEARRRLT